MAIDRGADGYFHPRSAAEVAELLATTGDVPVRVCGARMSHPPAIHGDGFLGAGAPPPGLVEVVLDRLADVEWVEERPDSAVLWVGAGCLLGPAYDDPTGESWKTSLTFQLQQKGYALDQMSGVSHQALGGFLMTGSAGGSVRHALHDDILALELVDGTGRVRLLERDSADAEARELFFAAGVSMGLLGVLTRVKLKVGRTFNVVGAEDTTPFEDTAFDLEGPGRGGKPTLAEYFTDADYARILWWPQHRFDRVQLWHARRQAPSPGFVRQPFEVLSRFEALFGSYIYTVLGNLEDMDALPGKLKGWYAELERALDPSASKNSPCAPPDHPPGGVARLREAVQQAVGLGVSRDAGSLTRWLYRQAVRGLSPVLNELWDGRSGALIAAALRRALPQSIGKLLGLFIRDGSRPFADSWMCGLPMDNGMSPTLWHTEFTELWVPLEDGARAVQLLHDYFTHSDAAEAYRRTGAYAVELYAGPPSDFWLSPGYGTACLRVNVFWFAASAGSPRDALYPPLWERLRALGLRLHWGKHLPDASDTWRAHYRHVHPQLERFLALRAALDPRRRFVSRYWREQLGID